MPDEVSEGMINTASYDRLAVGLWYFHIRAVDGVGNWGDTAHYSVNVIPETSTLFQNYPNPFGQDTYIPYQLKEASDVVIRIYSVTGQLVHTFDCGRKPADFYISTDKAYRWDGENEAGEKAAQGVYFYSINAGELSAVKKLTILK